MSSDSRGGREGRTGGRRSGERKSRTVGRHYVSQVITVSKAQQQGQTNKPNQRRREEEER